MISADNNFVLSEAGDVLVKSSNTLEVRPDVYRENYVVLNVVALNTTGEEIARAQFQTDKTVIDAISTTATNPFAKYFEACQKRVKTELEALTDNSGVTFTII